ncbi:MAG: helix-turn-helix transcriptional regulator [Gemmatimonadales bacterium]
MLSPTRTDRFFDSTRGKIVTLLRRAGMTADELAQALRLTDNAIRAHLTTLERDGLVRPGGARHEGRIGKPATVYQLSPDADPLFSKAYRPLLTTLLGALGERLPRAELRRLLREVGRRLAASAGPPSGDLGHRVLMAADVLNRLGGLTTVQEVDEGSRFVIRGYGCPLGIAVAERPEVCQVIGGLVEELTGARVRSCCSHGERPSCCFEATAP